MKNYLKQNLPGPILFVIRSILRIPKEVNLRLKIKKAQSNYKKALGKLKGKQKIKVAFFLIHQSVWKWEGVYRLMENDEKFEPVIIVCPYTVYGEETMLLDMNSAYTSFKNNGYNVIKSLDEEKGEWLDVKKTINPDIVCFTNPWRLTRNEYYIENYFDTLTCYVPYFFHVTKHLKENYGGIVQNICWKVFYETEVHLDYAKIYSKNKASNVIVTGYPALELLLKGKAKKDPWKIKNKYLKRIIWAPHHTINSQGCGLNLSNFELYANFIFEIAQKNFSRIQIAFKPHPLLKTKLINDPSWGKNKTNSYFESWNELNNCFLVDGNYIDLFLTSDAMIHDSGSFTVEYLCTQKPVLYTLKNMNQLNSLNEFGKNAVNCHYKALNTSDIEKFIFKTVLNENDPMKHKRKDFKKKYLNSSKNASQKIFNNISKEIYSYL